MDQAKISTVYLWGTPVAREQEEAVFSLLSSTAYQREYPRRGDIRWLASPSSKAPIPLFMTCWNLPDQQYLGILAHESSGGHGGDGELNQAMVVHAWEQEQFAFLCRQCEARGIVLPDAQLISLTLAYCEVIVPNSWDNGQVKLPDLLANQVVIWNRFLTTQGFSLFEAYIAPAHLAWVEDMLFDWLQEDSILGFHVGRR